MELKVPAATCPSKDFKYFSTKNLKYFFLNFEYPGHRASLDHDDDVSRQYIRGSRSPPGIANHLLRSARTDKKEYGKKEQQQQVEYQEVKTPNDSKSIGCSAKKRWLMAAMSVDMSETGNLI